MMVNTSKQVKEIDLADKERGKQHGYLILERISDLA